MRKETRKEFVVGKDTNFEGVNINKGDIVQIFPLEFFDSCDADYRTFVKEDCQIQEDLAVDVSFITLKSFKRQFTTGDVDIKFSMPLNICHLPDVFNYFKIAPRNVTVEFDD